jgi:hypothetical protein
VFCLRFSKSIAEVRAAQTLLDLGSFSNGAGTGMPTTTGEVLRPLLISNNRHRHIRISRQSISLMLQDSATQRNRRPSKSIAEVRAAQTLLDLGSFSNGAGTGMPTTIAAALGDMSSSKRGVCSVSVSVGQTLAADLPAAVLAVPTGRWDSRSPTFQVNC